MTREEWTKLQSLIGAIEREKRTTRRRQRWAERNVERKVRGAKTELRECEIAIRVLNGQRGALIALARAFAKLHTKPRT